MKASVAYLKAAELIASGKHRYCCLALAELNADCEEMKRYFEPRPSNRNNQYGGFWMACKNEEIWGDEQSNRRVLALCLMACIARDSERGK